MKFLCITVLVLASATTLLPTSDANPLLSLLGGGGGGGGIGGGGGLGGGLVGSLLGGPGGLLNGLLGGKDGLLGSLGIGKILNTLLCLIEQLGLGVVVDLVHGLGITKAIGLNEIACEEGGDQLLGFLLGKDGLLRLDIIDQVLCMVKSLKLEVVLQLCQQLGLDNALGLHEIVCPDGKPLMNFDEATSGLLGILTSESGLLSLGGLLKNGLSVQVLVGDVLCVVNEIGLQAATDVVKQLGLDELLNITKYVCKDGKPLFSSGEIKGLLGILSSEKGLLGLGGLLKDGLSVQVLVGDVLCVVNGIGLQAATDVVKQLGLDKLLNITKYVCKDGKPLFSSEETTGLLGILSSQGVLLSLGGLLENGVDIQHIVGELLCLVNELGLKAATDLVNQLGLAKALNIAGYVCRNGEPLFTEEGHDLFSLIAAIGADQVDTLIAKFGTDVVSRIAVVVTIGGTINVDILTTLICVMEALGGDTVLQLVQSTSLSAVISISAIVCPNGNPLTLGPSVDNDLLAELLVLCQNGETECTRAVSRAFIGSDCTKVCSVCSFIPVPASREECNQGCQILCAP